MSDSPDKRCLKSYVWHEEQCFFISTIERELFAAANYGGRYHETMAWKFDWPSQEKGEQVCHTGDGPAFIQHFAVCEQLHATGTWKDPRGD